MSDPLRNLGSEPDDLRMLRAPRWCWKPRSGTAPRRPVLIEATCNQVNQEGGYTGQTPTEFRARVEALARASGLPRDLLLLGGDYLGPNPWTALPAEVALGRAEAMVAAYVAAGFRKLHLDTSMPCADDPIALPQAVIAGRAARLTRVAVDAACGFGMPMPLHVIGTEVPPPGDAREAIEALTPTSPDAGEVTNRRPRAGLSADWDCGTRWTG